MPEVIITYKNKRDLEALYDFAKYFDYEISMPDLEKKESGFNVNGVTVIAADNLINTAELNEIFTGKNIRSSDLRKEAWLRKK